MARNVHDRNDFEWSIRLDHFDPGALEELRTRDYAMPLGTIGSWKPVVEDRMRSPRGTDVLGVYSRLGVAGREGGGVMEPTRWFR